MKNKVLEEVKHTFRPEFLNRVDEVVVFHQLTRRGRSNRSSASRLAKVIREVKAQDMHLEVTEDAKALLARKGWDPQFGARPLRRAIQREVEDELAEELLKGNFAAGDRILAEVNPDNPDKLRSRRSRRSNRPPRRRRRLKRSASQLQSTPTGLTPLADVAVAPPGRDRLLVRPRSRPAGPRLGRRRAASRCGGRGPAKIEAVVRDRARTMRAVTVEWGGGTGPLALRTVCSCGASGICEHVVATLEAVRSQTEPARGRRPRRVDLAWLPTPQIEAPPAARAQHLAGRRSPDQRRRRVDGDAWCSIRRACAARFATPRSIVAMMDATPADDWDDADRELMRDEAVAEAFGAPRGGAAAGARAVSARRAIRASASTTTRAAAAIRRSCRSSTSTCAACGCARCAAATGFVPALESRDGERFSPRDAHLLEGPPSWLATQARGVSARRIVRRAQRHRRRALGERDGHDERSAGVADTIAARRAVPARRRARRARHRRCRGARRCGSRSAGATARWSRP